MLVLLGEENENLGFISSREDKLLKMPLCLKNLYILFLLEHLPRFV